MGFLLPSSSWLLKLPNNDGIRRNLTTASLFNTKFSSFTFPRTQSFEDKNKLLIKVRAARAVRLFFLIQPIRSLFFDVVFAVAVVFATLFDTTF